MNETQMAIFKHMVTVLDWVAIISVFATLFVLCAVMACAMKIAFGHIWEEMKSTPGMIIREFKTNKYFLF